MTRYSICLQGIILNSAFSILNSLMPKRYVPNDKWSQKAAEEGYRARSVYKLKELDERFHLISTGMTVLDLGAAPGSWLQYASEKVGPKGKVIGIDLKKIESIAPNVSTYVQDITDIDAVQKILDTDVDIVLSDLAPNTSGIRDIDQWKSIELSHAVVKTAKHFLLSGGMCVMKVLRGGDFDGFLKELKNEWEIMKKINVKASRDRSNEIYIILKLK